MIPLLALAVSLAAHAAGAPAPAPEPAPAPAPAATLPKTPDELDRAAEDRIKAVEDCVDTLDYFREDLKTKKASLEKEFKGEIPPAFSNLLNLKANRISKQQLACSKVVSGADQPLEASLASARTMDGSSSAYASRRKKLDALRERLNKALKRFMAD